MPTTKILEASLQGAAVSFISTLKFQNKLGYPLLMFVKLYPEACFKRNSPHPL